MRLWRPVAETVWQGRDDSAEASNATRIFQTIRQQGAFTPLASGIALIGFECDAGVNAIRAGPAPCRRLMCCVRRWQIWQAIWDTSGWRIWGRFTLKVTTWKRHSRR